MTRRIIVKVRLILVVSGILLTTACGVTANNSSTYLGWHCQDTGTNQTLNCEQGQITNGQPAIAEQEKNTASDANQTDSSNEQPASKSLPQKKPSEIIWLGDHRKQAWREQLPDIDSVESKGSGSWIKSVKADRPTPVPEVAFADWVIKKGGNRLKAEESSEPNNEPNKHVAHKAISEASRNDGASSNASTRETPAKGYTIQLGAFDTAESAQRFLSENNLLHLNITRKTFKNKGRNWQVITFGRFADQQSALKAWVGATENSEKIAIWVRRVRP